MIHNLKRDERGSVDAGGAGGGESSAEDEWESFGAQLVGLTLALKSRALVLLQNRAAADDLVQDTLERALSNRRLFRDGTSLSAWTSSIMRNLFVDGWRRNAKCVDVDPDELAIEPYEQPAIGPIDVLRSADVCEALSSLRAREREIFELVYFERVSHREIATRFHMRVSTVGTFLFRTRAKLRKALEETFRRRARKSFERGGW